MKKTISKWSQPIVLTLGLVPMMVILGAAGGTILRFMSPLDFLDMAGVLADVSLVMFTAMLACTPLNIVVGWRWPLALKRPLGLYAFMYSAVHYLVFMAGFQFNIAAGLSATIASNMLFFGFLGVALMAPLAMTSNKWAMKTLGRNWKRLHYLVYAIAIFIVLHLLFLGQGALTTATYIVLLSVRIPSIRRTIVGWRQSWGNRAKSISSSLAIGGQS